jgi:hypothetical protein
MGKVARVYWEKIFKKQEQYENLTFEDFAFWSITKPSFTPFTIVVLFFILINNITNDLIFQVQLHITLYLRCWHYYTTHIGIGSGNTKIIGIIMSSKIGT